MVTRNLNVARRAFDKKNLKLSKEAHEAKEAEHTVESGKYLKSAVYGGLDGIITTFAVIAGVVGASLNSTIILILGFANLIGDGISMAIGDYLSTKSESEYYKREEERERWEVRHNPSGEEKEMYEIYREKGYSPKDAKAMVKLLTKNKKYWIETMMHEELGLINEDVNPSRNAITTFLSFLTFGFIPLAIFVFGALFKININSPFLLTSVLSAIALFTLGSIKSKITNKKWYKSGIEMLLVGGLAAIAAYFVGEFISKLV